MAKPIKVSLSDDELIKSFNAPSFKPRPPSVDEELDDTLDAPDTAVESDENDTIDDTPDDLNQYTPKGEPVRLDKIHPNLKKAMEDVERTTGIKTPITSGFRTQAEQDALDVPGKAEVSKHSEGRATDQRIHGLSGSQVQNLVNAYNKMPGISASVHNGNHIHIEYSGDDNQPTQLSDDDWLNQFIPPSKPPDVPQEAPKEAGLIDRAKNYLSSLQIPQPTQGRTFGKVGAPTREQAAPTGQIIKEFAEKPLLPESIATPASQALLAPTVPGLLLELAKPFSQTAGNIQKGLQGSIAENLQGFSTPESIATGVGLSTPAAPFILAGMTPGAIKSTYETGKQAYKNIAEGAGAEEITKNLSNTAIQALMAILGAKGATEIPRAIRGVAEPAPISRETVAEAPQAAVPESKILKATPEERADLEIQEKLYKKFGIDPYASAEKKIIKEETVPEARSALNAQVESVEKGNAVSALVTPEAESPFVPKKLSTVDTEVGKFVFDPKKTSAEEILSKVSDGTYGELLGYAEPKSPETSQIVTAETPKGQELKSAAVSPPKLDEQIAFLKEQFPEANIKVGGEEQAGKIIDQRLKNAPLDYLKEIGASSSDVFKRDLRKKFLLNEEKANAVSAITDARAEAWAKQTGRTPEEWYQTRIKGIERKTEAEGLAQGKIKGAVHFVEDGRAIIRAFQKADVSTAVHELGHVFRRDLEGGLLKTAEEWAGVKNGNWKRLHEERFARGFERYLREGEAPTPKLKQVFEQFKNWLSEIYKKITGSEINIKITPQIKEVFDGLLGSERRQYAIEGREIERGGVGEYKGIDTIREAERPSGGDITREGGKIEQKEEAPEAVRQRIRKEYRLKKTADLLKDALPEELKTLFQEAAPQALERTEKQRIASQEILRRVNAYAQEKGLSIQETLPRMNLTPEIYNKLRTISKGEKVPLLERGRPSPTIGETGLKTGKFVEGRESFRADKINAPEDIQRYLKATSERAGEFKEQRISKTDEGIKKLAEDVGITVEDLLKAKPGSIANAETVFKSRQMIVDLAKDLRDSIKSTDLSVATPEQIQALKEKHLRLMGVMKTVSGFRTEASNLFRQFRVKVDANETALLKDLMQKMKEAAIDDGASLEMFAKKARELTEPTRADKIWHLWYANILSGPFTHVKNILGNATSLANEITRVAITSPKEFTSSVSGIYNGLLKGAQESKRIFREGDVSKFEQRGKLPVKFKDKYAFLNAMDYVGRTLAATDAFFKGGFQGLEAGGLAKRQALQEGLRGPELKTRTKELFEEKYVSPEAVAFGERGTYNQKPEGPIGVAAEYIGRLTQNVPALKLVVPFTRVVANVLNNSIDYTPIGILRGVKPDLLSKEKPFNFETKRQKFQEIGRGAMGTIAMGYFATLAAQGIITGQGPKDYRKKQQLMATGWRPNSIKVGDKFYPYNSWGPLALGMAITGNYFDSMRYGKLDQEDLATRLGAAIMGTAKTTLDMSFLQNMSDLLSSIQNADKEGGSYFKRFVAQQVGSAVPALFKQVDRIFDPSVYETETLREKVQSAMRITSGLKQKLNVWGEPVIGEATSNLLPSKTTDDPLKKYLSESDLWVSVPSKNTKIFAPEDNSTGEKKDNYREMNRDEYYDYIKISGHMIKERLGDRLEKLKALPTKEMKQKEINSVVNSAREIAKKQVRLITLEKGEKK